MKPRYLEHAIADDLDRKMVFLDRPRQVGKTTLAQAIAGNWKGHGSQPGCGLVREKHRRVSQNYWINRRWASR